MNTCLWEWLATQSLVTLTLAGSRVLGESMIPISDNIDLKRLERIHFMLFTGPAARPLARGLAGDGRRPAAGDGVCAAARRARARARGALPTPPPPHTGVTAATVG